MQVRWDQLLGNMPFLRIVVVLLLAILSSKNESSAVEAASWLGRKLGSGSGVPWEGAGLG